MLELFSRVPDNVTFNYPGDVTPIPLDESVASLSAILLDDAYYQLLHTGIVKEFNLSWINEDVLIPFKIKAWLDLTERRQQGAKVDDSNIKKHFNDVLRLHQVMARSHEIALPPSIFDDVIRFLNVAGLLSDPTPQLFGKGSPSLSEILDNFRTIFVIQSTQPIGSSSSTIS